MWPWVLGGVILLLVVVVVAVAIFVVVGSKRSGGVDVTYEVEGTANSADITYTAPGDNSQSEHGVSLPWRKKVTLGTTVVLAALTVTTLQSGATVSCRVLADGKEVAQSGPTQMIVSCLGSTGNKWPSPTRSRR
ncbi:hypothetical protein A5634_12005 [Mycobacterium asiaticum]|uniref:MmpS protein n=1 Tax=Mycobacterium asiaticum TaxID=1790 RepID=A0A1A3NF05_MYCAS|nr:hypothetical protein A5634_12005 [Mycobacterium asiaticum]